MAHPPQGKFHGGGIQDVAASVKYPVRPGEIELRFGVRLGNGDGTLQDLVYFNAGIDPVSPAVADFDGDRLDDIAVANPGSNTVSVLFNNTPVKAPAVSNSYRSNQRR